MLIEHVTFELADGVDDDTFLDADTRVQQEFAPFEEGFIRRTTARGDGRTWLVEWLWFDDATADAAAIHAGEHPATVALASLVDDATVTTRRYTDIGG